MKHLGLASSVFLIASLVWLMVKLRADRNLTLSENAAQSEQGIQLYAIIFLVFALTFGGFMWAWFLPHFQAGKEIFGVFNTAIVFLLIAIFVPETKEPKRSIHILAAAGVAFSILLLTLQFTQLSSFSYLIHIMFASAAILMTIGLIAVAFIRKAQHYLLFAESLYFLTFLSAVISATYLS